MPLINEVYDSLPYIDREITSAERDGINALLTTELQATATNTSIPHPLLPPLPSSKFSPAITEELSRLEANPTSIIANGIDPTRYESLSSPLPTDPLSVWTETINQAYISQEYLSRRRGQLGLLEKYGRNTWLVGNEALETVLGNLEGELRRSKEEIDVVAGERGGRQGGVRGEMEGLEGVWKMGVGRIVEGMVAVERLGQEILGVRRERAKGGGGEMAVNG